MPNLTLPTLAAAFLLLGFLIPAQASTFKTLYHFTDKSDGGDPIGGVIADPSGTLYGETYQGGSYTCPNPPYKRQGCGTVYSLSKTGGFKLLASFTGASGAHGNIAPILVGNTLYGATAQGGSSNDGVIFSVNTDGTNFTVLHQFSGTDGMQPVALVAGTNGTLYGITEYGGADNYGVLFSTTQSGSYTVLYTFNLPANAYPDALIPGPNATLLGSTHDGGSPMAGTEGCCGTIFDYSETTGKFTNLFTYPATGADGGYPYVGSIGPGPTIYAGEFYAIDSLNAQSGLQVLAPLNSFTYGSGVTSGPVYTSGGILYGVLLGSVLAPDGVIYSLKNGIITDLYAFGGTCCTRTGSEPMAQPILTRSGTLIGTTTADGDCNDCGTVWEYTP